ncbi:MAG: MauE/DoxX family redox-associated membrane protein, partial [Actinomycetes bacterium]
MEAIALIARLALAVTFAVSAVAKLRDREGARQAVADFGVPESLVAIVAVALAPLELASAVLLMTTDLGVVGGAALGGAMLLAFTVAIVVNLQRGNRVDCHCFGAMSTKPLSWWSVGRNAALLVLAALVLTGGSSQPWPWVAVADLFAPLSTSETWLWVLVIALTAAVAVLGYLFFTLLRQYGHVLVRLEGIESAGHLGHAHGHGTDFSARPAPEVSLVDSDDVSLTLADVVADDRA